MKAKKLAKYVLSKETQIRVDVPLSVYADTFIVLGEERSVDGGLAFIQHVLDTNFLTDNCNTDDEFPDIPKQINKILDNITITSEAKQIMKGIGDVK